MKSRFLSPPTTENGVEPVLHAVLIFIRLRLFSSANRKFG